MLKNENLNIQETFRLALKKHINKKFNEAKILYNQILEIKPYHTNALNNLGELYRVTGDLQKAKDCYEKAIKFNPNLASAYNNLGLIYLKNKDNFKAKDLFHRAIELDPNLANANYNLGIIYKELGYYEKANSFYN